MNDAQGPAGLPAPAQTAAPDHTGREPGPPAPDAPDTASGPEAGPEGPAPLGVERTPSGDADVDAALRRLADADHLTTDGHVEVYEDVHRGLRDALTALDTRQGPPTPGHR
jgi:hypothetical protein